MTADTPPAPSLQRTYGPPDAAPEDSALRAMELELIRTALARRTIRQPLTACPDFELMLVRELVPHLRTRTAVDVGAERGVFAAAFVRLGLETVAIEASPSQALALRRRFDGTPGIRVLHVAVSSSNEKATLHLGRRPPGAAEDGFGGSAFNSLLDRPGVPEVIAFPSAMQVPCRTIARLVADGLLPAEPGVLKVDTEGHDLEVLRGAWPHLGEIVILEYWNRAFILNGGAVANDIPDYVRFLNERNADIEMIAIVRDEAANQICFQVNPRTSIAGSWGNVVLFKRPDLMCRAIGWCRDNFTSRRYRF